MLVRCLAQLLAHNILAHNIIPNNYNQNEIFKSFLCSLVFIQWTCESHVHGYNTLYLGLP